MKNVRDEEENLHDSKLLFDRRICSPLNLDFLSQDQYTKKFNESDSLDNLEKSDPSLVIFAEKANTNQSIHEKNKVSH